MRSSKKRERGDVSIDETRSRLREIADGTFKISKTATDDFDDDRDDLVEYEDVDVRKKQEKGAAYEDDVLDDDEEEEEDNVDELRGGKGRDESDGESGVVNRGRHIRKIRGEDAGPSMEADEKGVTLEPFNLRGEREEGYYDASGEYNYWKKSSKDEEDEEEEKDAWLDELDEMDPALRRKLQADVEAAHARKMQKEGRSSAAAAAGRVGGDDDEDDEADDDDERALKGSKDAPLFGDGDSDVSAGPQARCGYLQVLCDTLRDGETAAAALRRLGAGAKKRSWQKVDESVPKQSAEDLLAFNALTDALDGLVNDGLVDAYSLTRAMAKSELRQSQAEMKD